MRRFSRWLLRQLLDGLVHLSRMSTYIPYPVEAIPDRKGPEPRKSALRKGAEWADRADRDEWPVLNGPAAGHPERLCGEVPLTRTERMLLAEIDGMGTDGIH